MWIRLDHRSAEPIQDQVAQAVKRAVAAGELAAGDRLPSVRELARELVINPNTAARAYDRLEAEGVIVRRQGSGCFVAPGRRALGAAERRKKLRELADHLATEAFHLGCDREAIRREIDAALERLDFEGSEGADRP
jgi:GntR family transcriptional regulator